MMADDRDLLADPSSVRISTGCFKKSLTTLKPCINLLWGMYSVLNCHRVAEHTEFFRGIVTVQCDSHW
jgi:hypothetical protein